LQNVAVEIKRAFAQPCQIDHGAQASADQALDFHAAAVNFTATVARLARVRTTGQHAIFRCQPTLAAADQEMRHRLFYRASTQDGCLPHPHQHAAGRMARITPAKAEGTQFIRTTAIGTHGSTAWKLYSDSVKSHLRSAFWACIRFPACWKTILRSPSRTSSVTSSPRWAGTQ